MITVSQIPWVLRLWTDSFGISPKIWEHPRMQFELGILVNEGKADAHGFFDSINRLKYEFGDTVSETDRKALATIGRDAMTQLEFSSVISESAKIIKEQKKAGESSKSKQKDVHIPLSLHPELLSSDLSAKKVDTSTKKPTINPMNNQIAFIITGSGAISGVANGKTFTIQPDFRKYAEVVLALRNRDGVALQALIDTAASINAYGKGVCTVEGGVVYFNGKPLANVMTERILKQMREGFPFEPMLRFLENLLQNPLDSAIKELYLFLEASELPITEDGYFLAYKRVDADFKSKHASPDGTYMDHAIGTKPEMKRELVDADRHRTCSKGLHFCALSYLPHYGSDSSGDKTVIVKVNPADVVAIPSDYKNAKGRAWTYEVIAEHTKGETTEAYTQPVVSSDGGEYGLKPSGQRFYQVRDAKGHFVKRK